MRRIWSGIIAVGLVLGAGCGDDDDAGGFGGTVDAADDQAVVDAALLTIDDLPGGFTEEPVDDEDDDTANSICNERVLGLSDDDVDGAKTAEAGPAQFGGDEVRVRAEITAFESDEVPSQILQAVDDDEYLDCLTEALEAQLPEGVALVEVGAIDAAIDGADESGALVVHFDSGGTPVESQVHAARVGRYGVSLEVTALEGTVDAGLVATVLATMVGRLEDG